MENIGFIETTAIIAGSTTFNGAMRVAAPKAITADLQYRL